MNIFKIVKYAVIAAIIASLVVAIYYSWVLYSARRYTIETILPHEKTTRYPIDLSSLSSRQLEILLKVEDPRFFEHKGVDFSTPGAGITTITQGLVKHLYFDQFRPGIAKIRQTLIAVYVLNPLMSKEDQLRLFINTVYL
jgi:membrane carboxypeptidase/penicillin-binding protein